MNRNDVLNALKKFAKQIGADTTKASQFLGVGREIRTLDQSIRETLGDNENTLEWKKYRSLLFQININS